MLNTDPGTYLAEHEPNCRNPRVHVYVNRHQERIAECRNCGRHTPIVAIRSNCEDCGRVTGQANWRQCQDCHRSARKRHLRGVAEVTPAEVRRPIRRYVLTCIWCDKDIRVDRPKPRIPLHPGCAVLRRERW